ncbi:MAG: argininosuccinate lyase [Dehalococcoidales bacterium]|nr:argininosuccinate lyase [Dehalococcoidales bacterium]
MNHIRGRFQKDADNLALKYSASIGFDLVLAPYDIMGSMVHALMLSKQGIIAEQEATKIVRGLEEISHEISDGSFQFKEELEDIHMNIESRLIEKIGDTGKKLHTARSRNDQVALDIRLFLKYVINCTVDNLIELQTTLVETADKYKNIIIPGYTHLQQAQPVLLAHHLLAYYEMLERDLGRFDDCFARSDVMPLGSGALGGVPYPIDRQYVAKELDFNEISRNSIDAVSDRDFIIEYESAACICMMHLSRLAEELIIWSSSEFGFIELDDAYTTGSSIMPQKKNPDLAELARGKTGRVFGSLVAILTTMKGLPLAYNRDLQEDKEGLLNAFFTLSNTIEIFAAMLKNLKVNRKAIEAAVRSGYLLATDIADYLVSKGIPFRDANEITGRLVTYAIGVNKSFSDLTLAEYRQFSESFNEDVLAVTLETSVNARKVTGGTARNEVVKQIKAAKNRIKEWRVNEQEN